MERQWQRNESDSEDQTENFSETQPFSLIFAEDRMNTRRHQLSSSYQNESPPFSDRQHSAWSNPQDTCQENPTTWLHGKHHQDNERSSNRSSEARCPDCLPPPTTEGTMLIVSKPHQQQHDSGLVCLDARWRWDEARIESQVEDLVFLAPLATVAPPFLFSVQKKDGVQLVEQQDHAFPFILPSSGVGSAFEARRFDAGQEYCRDKTTGLTSLQEEIVTFETDDGNASSCETSLGPSAIFSPNDDIRRRRTARQEGDYNEFAKHSVVIAGMAPHLYQQHDTTSHIGATSTANDDLFPYHDTVLPHNLEQPSSTANILSWMNNQQNRSMAQSTSSFLSEPSDLQPENECIQTPTEKRKPMERLVSSPVENVADHTCQDVQGRRDDDGARTAKKRDSLHFTSREHETKDDKVSVAASIVPCRARGMAKDHNAKTAFFIIPNNIKNGEDLFCSHQECQKKGIRFVYCKVCQMPVAKINFSTRHKHPKTKNSTIGNLMQSTKMSSDRRQIGANIDEQVQIHETSQLSLGDSRIQEKDLLHQKKEIIRTSPPARPVETLQQGSRQEDKIPFQDQKHETTIESGGKRSRKTYVATVRNDRHDMEIRESTRSATVSNTKQERLWVELLKRRPPTSDQARMSAWISNVVNLTEPDQPKSCTTSFHHEQVNRVFSSLNPIVPWQQGDGVFVAGKLDEDKRKNQNEGDAT